MMTYLARAIAALLLILTVPLPLWAKCQLAKVTDLTPTILGSQLFVPGTVNGLNILMQLNTGVSTQILTGPAHLFGARTINQADAAKSGKDYVEQVAIDDLGIGQWHSKGVVLPALGAISSFGDPHAIAVLGEDILSKFDVEIDLANNVVALYLPQDCAGANLAYWSQNYNVVDFDKFDEHDPSIRFTGKINGQDVLMQMFTGATASFLSQDIASALGVGPDSAGAYKLAQPDSWVGRFTSFALDQESISPVRLRVQKFAAPAGQPGMVLGLDFIRAHHVLISHSQRKLYFSYSAGAPFDIPKQGG